MLPEGTYHGVIDEAVTSTASTGTPQMVITVGLGHVLNAKGEWDMVQGNQNAKVYLYLSDAAWPFTEEKLKKLGFNGDFGAPKFAETVYTDGVDVECKHESYQGKTRDKWQFAGGSTVEPAAPDAVRVLNARWKAKTGAPPAKPAGRPAPPPPKPAPAPEMAGAAAGGGSVETDPKDIPF